jgi:hypothetical protein
VPDEEGYVPESGPDLDTGGQAEATPQESYTPDWNWEEYADKRIPVKAGDQEAYVPLREARDGYMRHSDYTRKTQELSQRAQQLEYADAVIQSLRLNPADTLEFLRQEWLEDQAGEGDGYQDQSLGETGYGEPEELDPQERQLQELQAWREQVEQQQAEQMIHQEIAQLEQRFGSEYNWNEVLQHAIQTDAPNVTTAFKDLYFDTFYGESQAVRDARKAREDADQQQRAAAQSAAQAAGVVHHGGGVSGQGVSSGPSDGRMSVRQAWTAARNSQG